MIDETIKQAFRADAPEPRDHDELQSIVQRAVDEYLRRSLPAAGGREPASPAAPLRRSASGTHASSATAPPNAVDGAVVTAIVEDLERKGLTKTSLAARVLKDEIYQSDDGRLYGVRDGVNVPYSEYITDFLQANPEFLPARIAGGAGTPARTEHRTGAFPVQIEDIRPGMDAETHRRVWTQVARLTGQL